MYTVDEKWACLQAGIATSQPIRARFGTLESFDFQAQTLPIKINHVG